ncbi:unnamed protein product [Closterium sp. NIES-65]|nr:unnamed protein product [Closterium sp. NIES-65]
MHPHDGCTAIIAIVGSNSNFKLDLGSTTSFRSSLYGEESYAPRSDTCLEIIRLNALAAETPFRRPLSRPSLPVALSLSALFPSPPFPSRSLSPLPSHRALSLRSLPVALSPVALSLPPPLPSRSLSPLPSRRPLSRRPLSHRPRYLLRYVPSPSLSVALSPVALSPIALALFFVMSRRPLSRRPLSLTSPSLCPVAHALSRRPRSLPFCSRISLPASSFVLH